MKVLTISITVMLLAVFLFSGTLLAQSSYTAEDTGLTFNYPDGWEISYSDGFVWMVKVANDDMSPAISIEIFDMAADPELKDITGVEPLRDKLLVSYGEVFDKLQIVSKTSDETGAYALMTYNRKYDFTSLAAFLIKDNRALVLSYEEPAETFNETEAKEKLDMIINSLTFSK